MLIFQVQAQDTEIIAAPTDATLSDNHDTPYYQVALPIHLLQADVDDAPVNGVTTAPVSSNWAYDHAAGKRSSAYWICSESGIGTTLKPMMLTLTTWQTVL